MYIGKRNIKNLTKHKSFLVKIFFIPSYLKKSSRSSFLNLKILKRMFLLITSMFFSQFLYNLNSKDNLKHINDINKTRLNSRNKEPINNRIIKSNTGCLEFFVEL